MKKNELLSMLVFLVLSLLIASPRDAMKPAETGQIKNTKFFALNNTFVSAYLVKSSDGYILIDAGVDKDHLLIQLNELSIGLNEVKWVFLTHSDGDHVAALSLLPEVPLYMNIEEKQLLDGRTKRNETRGNKLPDEIDLEKINYFEDNQTFTFQDTTIKCMTATGHTPGSTLFLIDNQYLITGDAISFINGKIEVHPFTMDEKLAKESIKQHEETFKKSKIVMTAHYGFFEN